MINASRLGLQIAVSLAGLVPVYAGSSGAIVGLDFFSLSGGESAESHVRYLSGLLLGIGLMFWSCVPRIETKTIIFRTLTLIVFAGGLARLAGLGDWTPTGVTIFALIMELIVTPLLCFWQAQVAAQAAYVSENETLLRASSEYGAMPPKKERRRSHPSTGSG